MFIRFSLILLLCLSGPTSAALSNQLKNHPSPYLALHGNDPVHWQQWGPQVLQQARTENKLILVSVGYFSCHWCHVMQRESYQSKAIAEILNRAYLSVKIDRELEPVLDARLIEFVRRTRGHAGWPLNVFLTPDGYPLIGFTYSPPEKFQRILLGLESRWQQESDQLKVIARTAFDQLAQSEDKTNLKRALTTRRDLHGALVSMALLVGDDLEGGFGQGSRFPMVPQLMALLERLEASPDEKLAGLLTLTLDQMARLGLRDHLAGGFFRYTVDPGWQEPHFEKMLYTQALVSRLYLLAARVLERPDYVAVAQDTLDFVLKSMSGRDGGYISSFSAVDAHEVEGGGYLWSDEQLVAVLDGDELLFARRRWQLSGERALEGGYLPVDGISPTDLASGAGKDSGWAVATEQRLRQQLLKARQGRAHPKDGKQLAAWNGLLLTALVEAHQVTADPAYRQAAKNLSGYLHGLWDGDQLWRSKSAGRPLGSASLEDYVYVSQGLSAWAKLSSAEDDGVLAKRLLREAWERFYSINGWLRSQQGLLPNEAGVATLEDGPMPSPVAVLIEMTLDGQEGGLQERAVAAREMGYPRASESPLSYATHTLLLINAAPAKDAD